MLDENIPRVKQFETTPETEAKGQIMAAWISTQLGEMTKPRLEAHGITDIDFEEWYPYQTFLDIMREIIASGDNVTSILVSVGKAVVPNLGLSDFPTMEAFRGFIENLYHGVSVRNAPKYEDNYLIEKDGKYYIVNNTPVSNDLFYGFLWEVLSHYKVEGVTYIVIPVENYPSEYGATFWLKPDED